MRNCANCQKDLSSAKLTNHKAAKDLLICVQCYWLHYKKKNIRAIQLNHFTLLKRSGEVDGSSEIIVMWDCQKDKLCSVLSVEE